MKGGNKFKLKTGTIGVGLLSNTFFKKIGDNRITQTLDYLFLYVFFFISFLQKLPPKRPNLPAELFNMKSLSAAGEEVEEEEEEEEGEAAERKEDKDEENSAAEMIIDAGADSGASERAEAAQLNGKNSDERSKVM